MPPPEFPETIRFNGLALSVLSVAMVGRPRSKQTEHSVRGRQGSRLDSSSSSWLGGETQRLM